MTDIPVWERISETLKGSSPEVKVEPVLNLDPDTHHEEWVLAQLIDETDTLAESIPFGPALESVIKYVSTN